MSSVIPSSLFISILPCVDDHSLSIDLLSTVVVPASFPCSISLSLSYCCPGILTWPLLQGVRGLCCSVFSLTSLRIRSSWHFSPGRPPPLASLSWSISLQTPCMPCLFKLLEPQHSWHRFRFPSFGKWQFYCLPLLTRVTSSHLLDSARPLTAESVLQALDFLWRHWLHTLW